MTACVTSIASFIHWLFCSYAVVGPMILSRWLFRGLGRITRSRPVPSPMPVHVPASVPLVRLYLCLHLCLYFVAPVLHLATSVLCLCAISVRACVDACAGVFLVQIHEPVSLSRLYLCSFCKYA